MQQAYKSYCLTVGNAISLIFIGFEFTRAKSRRSVGNERTICRYSIQRETDFTATIKNEIKLNSQLLSIEIMNHFVLSA